MDLIERLKHNEKPFGLLSKEEQGCFGEVGKANCQIFDVEWDQAYGEGLFSGATYRIKPDYQPESLVEKCEVIVSKRSISCVHNGCEMQLEEALSGPGFSTFLDKDGNPMKIRGDYDLHSTQGKPAPIPKYVLFVRSK